jgi:ferredoxin/flavodoxin
MKAAIIVFSPTGNTLKVAEMLEKKFKENGIQVQILDITRNGKLFHGKRYERFLNENVKKHDVLLVGAPVYAHHMHYNMIDIIKSLPKVNERWGKLAIPFVTYGGISSGLALFEAAKILKKTGRIVVSGMKINSFHVMSRILSTEQNTGMPGEEAIPLIQELANRITGMSADTFKDITKQLDYQNIKNRIKSTLIFREKFWQNHFYPKVKYNEALCNGCGACVSVCPIQRLELKDRRIVAGKNGLACIHCTQCVYACPAGALDFDCDKEKWDRLFSRAASGKGQLPSNEIPKSAVYPLELASTIRSPAGCPGRRRPLHQGEHFLHGRARGGNPAGLAPERAVRACTLRQDALE